MKSVKKKTLGKALLSENGLPKPINVLKMTPSKMAALVAPHPRPPSKGKKRPNPHQGCALRQLKGALQCSEPVKSKPSP